MLKMPSGCRLFNPKCSFYEWGLGEKVDKEHMPERFELAEKVRMRQMPPCCMKHLREILWYLHDLFEEQGLIYWLDFGTLLGAIRGGRSIPHDTDGDICMFLKDREQVLSLQDRFKKDGFCLNLIKPAREDDTHLKVCRSKKNFMIVDIFFWHHDKRAGVYRSDGLNIPKSFPDWWVTKLEQVSMFDKMMWCPREPEKFLEMRFGKDWRQPQNKKVHFEDAIEAHRFGFWYASQQGWRRTRKFI